MPWDMTPGHRQFNPRYILNKASRFVTEAFQTLDRRDKGSPDPVWLQSGMYPQYYLNTFHYQVLATSSWADLQCTCLSSWHVGTSKFPWSLGRKL